MTIFAYGFGMAISIALAVAIGNAWVREHRKGVWTLTMAGTVTALALFLGVAIGWGLAQYFAFVAESATGRM
ncbi:MAG: hypothetical protein WBG27_15115 [Candidatus Aquilonibacter sp.]